MDTLATELAARLDQFTKNAPADARALIEADIAALRASGAEDRVLKPGATLPRLTLTDAHGAPAALDASLPAIIVFYRGGWCPYCNLQLRAWQRHLPEVTALGARLIAISPEKPDNSLTTAEKNGLGYTVLSDGDGAAAAAFGLDFILPEPLRVLYTRFGHALPDVNVADDWQLPIPATFVVGRDGALLFAEGEVEYRRRVEPARAIAALRAVQS